MVEVSVEHGVPSPSIFIVTMTLPRVWHTASEDRMEAIILTIQPYQQQALTDGITAEASAEVVAAIRQEEEEERDMVVAGVL